MGRTCPYGVHSNKHGGCSCGMKKGSGSLRRTEVRGQRGYNRAAPRSMQQRGCSSASARRAGSAGSGCLIMSVLLSLAVAVLGRLVRR